MSALSAPPAFARAVAGRTEYKSAVCPMADGSIPTACGTWRNGRGRPARWPDLVETAQIRHTRVILAAAHLDHDPRNNRLRNLKSLCQRCHMIHDRPYHLVQRRITYLLRRALGDLFLGPYSVWRVRKPMRISGQAIGMREALRSNPVAGARQVRDLRFDGRAGIRTADPFRSGGATGVRPIVSTLRIDLPS